MGGRERGEETDGIAVKRKGREKESGMGTGTGREAAGRDGEDARGREEE